MEFRPSGPVRHVRARSVLAQVRVGMGSFDRRYSLPIKPRGRVRDCRHPSNDKVVHIRRTLCSEVNSGRRLGNSDPMATSLLPFDPLRSSAQMIVYIDYKSPFSYLARDPTYGIEDTLGIEIDWRPLILDIPSYLGSARLDAQGRVIEAQRSERQWQQIRYGYGDIRRYGSLRNLVVRGTTKIWDSSLAALGMLWARGQDKASLRAYSNAVFEQFWKRDLDIEDFATIEAVLLKAGVRTEGFKSYAMGQGRELLDQMQRAIFDAAIFGVPTYIVDGEVYFGREHLPRVRWQLGGSKGAPPDIAYEGPSRPLSTGGAKQRKVSVAIDFKSPHAYLAVGPTCALAEELGLIIDWRPFPVAPLTEPILAYPGHDRGARHRRFRAQNVERDLMRYAADRGLAIRGLYRQTDSSLAAIGLLWTKGRSESLARTYVQLVFERYWREELDIQESEGIRRLLTEIDVPTAGFDKFLSNEGRAQLERERLDLLKDGVFEVPTFKVDEELFVGRQHLPLIRSLLLGNR